VIAGVAACLAGARLLLAVAADGVAGFALALPDAALLFVTEPEARDVDLRDGDGNDVLALPTEQLALRDVLL